MKKYELTNETIEVNGKTLYRIKALRDIEEYGVHAGNLGGYIEKEENLSHNGSAWVYGNARVYDSAMVYGNAWVYDNARVHGNARVYGNARVHGNARVYDNAMVSGNARVYGDADYLCFKGLGSCNRDTTFFKCKDGHIHVNCGCFSGNLEEFTAKVKETHGESKYAKEYLACVNVVKIHFEEE